MRAIRITAAGVTLCAVAFVACKPKSVEVSRDRPIDMDAARDAGAIVAAPSDASTRAEAGVPSAFALVARQNGTIDLQRIENSPVLASSRGGQGYAYVLSPDGTIAPLEPVATIQAETHDGMGWDMGRIAGVWPSSVYVELAIAGGRAETVIEHYLVDVEKRTFTRKSFGDNHVATAQKWSDGRLLGWIADTSSVMGPFENRTGRFEVLAGRRPAAMPVWPKKAGMSEGELAVYESGRIFALAGREIREGEWDHGYVWDFVPGAPAKPVKLHDDLRLVALERGRNEREALAIGSVGDDAFLARFDGNAWVEVKLPFTDGPSSLSTGDDGSVWIVTGFPEHLGRKMPKQSKLWRADFPDLRFTQVAIDPSYVLKTVMARNANDVWLVAATGEDLRTTALFHTQTAKPDVFTFGDDDTRRAVLSKKDPPPWYPGCVVPFILLGREEDVKEEDVRALAASLVDWPHADHGVLVRVQSGRVYGFEISHERYADPGRYQTTASTFATVKAKYPAAKLVCTRARIEKELEPPAKPKP